MPNSNDCTNTQSTNGQNLTPLPFVEALHHVFPTVWLDPASDPIANESIKAKQIYTIEDDGFTQDWVADSVFLNPPGRSLSNGKQVSAAQWFRRLYSHWVEDDIRDAIGLVYRMASIGSLGCDLLSTATLCITAKGAKSSAINGSGRFAFDIVESGDRIPQTSNTQSSGIFLLTDSKAKERLFREAFEQFGVIK